MSLLESFFYGMPYQNKLDAYLVENKDITTEHAARVSGSQSDWDSYKTVKKELQGEYRKVYSNYINNLVSEDDSPT